MEATNGIGGFGTKSTLSMVRTSSSVGPQWNSGDSPGTFAPLCTDGFEFPASCWKKFEAVADATNTEIATVVSFIV
jgi:hypothetical protein